MNKELKEAAVFVNDSMHSPENIEQTYKMNKINYFNVKVEVESDSRIDYFDASAPTWEMVEEKIGSIMRKIEKDEKKQN